MKRRLWFLGGLVAVAAAVLTGSRGGFIGLVLVTILFVKKLTRHRLVGLAVAGILLGGVLLLIPNPLVERLFLDDSDSSTRTGVEQSNQARVAEVKGGLRMIRARPLTGVGLGNFSTWMEKYPDLGSDNIAHNSYLEVAAELGLPALFVFLAVMLATYRSLSRSAKIAQDAGDHTLRDFVVALQVGFVGYGLSAVFLSAQYEKYWWLAIFLSICFERVAKSVKSTKPERLDSWAIPRPLASRRQATFGSRF